MPIFASFAASGLASKLLSATKAAFAKILLSTSGGYSTALTSDPGSWTDVSSSDVTNRIVDYAYGNGVYVITGQPGPYSSTPRMMYGASPDGSVENITWNGLYSLDDAFQGGLTFIPEVGKFFFRGVSNSSYPAAAIYVSTNGETWNEYPTALSSSVGDNVAYVNGKLFIPISGKKLMDTSTDGVTWTASGSKSGPQFYNAPAGLNYFNGYFWTFNEADTYTDPGTMQTQGRLRYSTDLVTWASTLFPYATSRNYYGNSVQVLGSRIIVGAPQHTYFSTNGTSWTIVSMQNGTSMNSPMAYGNSRWAVVVTANMGQNYYVNYSTNGTSFTQGTNIGYGGAVSFGNDGAGQPIQPQWNSLVYGTAFVVSGSYQDTSNYNTYTCTMRSTDAVTWTNFVKHNANSNSYGQLAYAGSSHVMASGGYSDSTKAIAASTNGITWTYSAHPDLNGTQTSLSSVNNTFILQGSPSTVIYSSTNGTTWTSRETQQTGYWPLWTYGAGKYVTNKSDSTDVIQSTDLVTWGGTVYTGAVVSDGNDKNVAYSSTVALVGGHRSTDGTTWTEVAGSPAADGNGGIAFGNGIFLYIQTYGTVSTSTDGITWSQTASRNAYVTVPKFIDGKFYTHDSFIGNSGYHTTNGVTWTSFSLPSGYQYSSPFVGKP